jgi:hypothetical protein
MLLSPNATFKLVFSASPYNAELCVSVELSDCIPPWSIFGLSLMKFCFIYHPLCAFYILHCYEPFVVRKAASHCIPSCCCLSTKITESVLEPLVNRVSMSCLLVSLLTLLRFISLGCHNQCNHKEHRHH